MILDDYVKVVWKSRSRKQYENLGYKFTNYGDIFDVKIEDMPKGSHYKVTYSCDNCGKIDMLSYKDYLKGLVNGKKYCHSCASKLLASTTRNKQYLENGTKKSFYDYVCGNFSKEYFNSVWDYEKNAKSPKEIFSSSRDKVWLKCAMNPSHASYLISTNQFHRGHRCPYCSGKSVDKTDSLGEKHKDSLKVWSIKNDKSPYDYLPYSNKSVWWKCENNRHSDYMRVIGNAVLYDFKCPCCIRELNNSLLQNAVNEYLENDLKYDVLHEFGCSIIPVNAQTGKQMPFDNEVVELKLIIEVHGKQHYHTGGYVDQQAKANNVSPEEQLEYQKWKDEYKKNYALEHGYFYLEIPYTAYENDEYKTMIDDKIKEIVNRGEFQ